VVPPARARHDHRRRRQGPFRERLTDHADHVRLIRSGVEGAGPRWLELGAGRGAFTIALAELLGPGGEILALDRDRKALAELARTMAERYPSSRFRTEVADFTDPLPIEAGSFDGVVAANALHFVRDTAPVLAEAAQALRPGGRFVVVEYGSDHGNPWVPWPFSYATWSRLAEDAGLVGTRLIGEVPSRFLGSIYGAVSTRPPRPE
jgi:SAM-dependent methyltransferase